MKGKFLYLLLLLVIYPGALFAQSGAKEAASPPTLTVTGHGEIFAAPDRAVVRVGVIAQEKEAANAQARVNVIGGQVIEAIQQMNIPAEKLTTVGLTLSPVYSRQGPAIQEEAPEPIIVAYRARNTIQVVIEDLSRVGGVIDASVKAGANQLDGLSFDLKDDAKHKDQALRLAVQEARRKAEAIASAMGVEIENAEEVLEGGISILRPQVNMARAFSAEAAAPIAPGQVGVEASVTIRYRITADKPQSGWKTGS